MRFRDVVTRLSAVVLILSLAGCVGGAFRTHYDNPAPASDWRVTDVVVTVPTYLVVSESETLFPNADIVWREDPRSGNRYQQVAKLMDEAITRGASGLRGSRPVRLEVTMARFHAMTFSAETRAPSGVHDVEFTITARDARTGQALAGPDYIEASLPAMTGAAMAAARVRGDSQKKQIQAHVTRTIAGWLGAGPDQRMTFSSLGG